MQTWIALLRGINVLGRNSLPMTRLVGVLEATGCSEVRTYIQSGNAVFRSPQRDAAKLAGTIGREIQRQVGFQPHVLLLTVRDLEKAIAANSFPEAEDEPKSLHLFFLADKPARPNLDGLEKRRADSERYKLIRRVFYLHTPDGFGRSKLAARVEKLLGVPATARNWRSVQQVAELARAIA